MTATYTSGARGFTWARASNTAVTLLAGGAGFALGRPALMALALLVAAAAGLASTWSP